jgi:hypothetical protein
LDLSHNGLEDLEDLGLRASQQSVEAVAGTAAMVTTDASACTVPLKRLDLRFNNIQALTPGTVFYLFPNSEASLPECSLLPPRFLFFLFV